VFEQRSLTTRASIVYRLCAVQLITLEKHIKIALAADRPVGIYPETKFPEYHDKLLTGTTMSDIVLHVLRKYGYKGPMHSRAWRKQPVLVQSFEVRRRPIVPSVANQLRCNFCQKINLDAQL
jgi:glycerophosphoryl diester phosphodiesterase